MHREHQRWHSPSLGRDMDLLVFGHDGARVLVFPTSQGRFHEWEDQGMIGALAEPLERGALQLVCVDSVDAESWYAMHRHPSDRGRRHTAYDAYLSREVVPFSEHRNRNPFLIAAGASFGAYHALAFGLRHPDAVGRVLGMSGRYDITGMTDGVRDTDIHYASPPHLIEHEADEARLAAIRHIDIILAIGRDDPSFADNERMTSALWQRGIPHAFRVWDGWAHDWPWWRNMVVRYIGGHD